MSSTTAPSLWTRARARVSGSVDQADDTALRAGAREAGCRPLANQQVGDVVTVHGELRTVTIQPRRGARALEAALCDGSGTLTLVWLGRCRIPGIAAGRALTASGRLGLRDGERVLYNPRYELSR